MIDPRLDELVSVHDLRARAASLMDDVDLAYFDGGAGDESALRDAEAAFLRHRLIPRIGEDRVIDLQTTLLGSPVSMPIGVAPFAGHGRLTSAAERAAARAARAASTLLVASSASTLPVEEFADDAGPWWYQCYPSIGSPPHDALRAGAAALVLTVDGPAPGYRDRELRTTLGAAPRTDGWSARSPRAVTWESLSQQIAESPVPVVLKGILHADDARRAVDIGAAAIWVSNHGGRQLDRALAPIDALATIVDVSRDTPVFVDGGFRRGVDVALALALGASAVFVARPVAWGLVVADEAGAQWTLDQLRLELSNALIQLGAARPRELNRSSVCLFGDTVRTWR